MPLYTTAGHLTSFLAKVLNYEKLKESWEEKVSGTFLLTSVVRDGSLCL